jgi:hypothetical protein
LPTNRRGLPHGKQDAQIVDAILQLTELATALACLIVCESLDFTGKKAQLRKKSAKYARMLSSWSPVVFISFWSRFYPIVAFLYLVAIGAYTSLIGLVKYARMYGLYLDIAAELGNCQERYELQ